MQRCNAVHRLDRFDFEVWFNRRTDGGVYQQWEVTENEYEFTYRYVPPVTLFGRRLAIPIDAMASFAPDLIVHDYWPWPLALGVVASKATSRRTALRVLPSYDSWSHRTAFGEISKRFIFRAVDGAKVSGPDGAAFAARYGLPRSRASFVTQSVDTARFEAQALNSSVGPELRRRLGLVGCTFLFVGRLWTGKGLDQLFNAYERLCAEVPDVSLVLVGDGPDEARYRARAAGLPNVTFAGWVEDELEHYFAASDVLVFPTLGDPYGLVVEEAMAAGLPVITSDAAGDIRERVGEPERGFVAGRDDWVTLSRRMAELAYAPELRRTMGQAAMRYALTKNHDHHAADFARFVEQQLALPRRRSLAALAATGAGRALQKVARPSG